MTQLWITAVGWMVLLSCIAADDDSGATSECNDLCRQMALHMDYEDCRDQCMVAVADLTRSNTVSGQSPTGDTTTSKDSRQRIGERSSPFVRIGRTFVRIGRQRAANEFQRSAKHWPYGEDGLSAKRVASFVRIGRSAEDDEGDKRTSSFVRIGKRSPNDVLRSDELAQLVQRLSAYAGEISGDTELSSDKRGRSPFVRIGKSSYFAEQKRPQFVRIGRR